jgi:predicted MFS family arabinose efflux permease
VALLCYAALGAVLRLLPTYVQGHLRAGPFAVGIAVGAPAMAAVLTRPFGGRQADRRGPMPVLVAGAFAMAVVTAPLILGASLPALLASRFAVGTGEGLMMSAAVLWLLRLAGPERRGRALGHIGLANYGGLTLGPLLADALGTSHAGRIFAAAAVLPVLGALAGRLPERVPGDDDERAPMREVVRRTARAGAGLMLVNFGYVALLSFGSDVVAGHAPAGAALVVPAFAAVVILTRTAAASVPDRFGATPTLVASSLAAAGGLVLLTLAHSTVFVVVGVATLAAGQALAVPALGLLALARVPAAQHGAAAGAFFAWFDGGVAIGGAAVGAIAHLTSQVGALLAAAACVAAVPAVSARRSRQPG